MPKIELYESRTKSRSDMWLAAAAGTVPVSYVLAQFYVIHSTQLLRQSGFNGLLPTMNQVLAPQFFLLIGVAVAAVVFGKTSELRRICRFKNWSTWFIPIALGLETALFIPFLMFSWLSLILIKALKPFAPEQVDVILKLSEALQKFIKNSDWSVFCVIVLAAVVIAPIVEEIVFRGVLFNCISHRFGIVAGVVSTSLIFAVFHLNAVAFLVLFSLGVVLQILYVKTKSIFSCMIFHAVHNAVAMGILCILKISQPH